jgi:hypothetical protein
MPIIYNLFAKLLNIQNDEHLGPPAERIARLEAYRGQGDDQSIDAMQSALQAEIDGRLTDADLLAAFEAAVRRSEGR